MEFRQPIKRQHWITWNVDNQSKDSIESRGMSKRWCPLSAEGSYLVMVWSLTIAGGVIQNFWCEWKISGGKRVTENTKFIYMIWQKGHNRLLENSTHDWKGGLITWSLEWVPNQLILLSFKRKLYSFTTMTTTPQVLSDFFRPSFEANRMNKMAGGIKWQEGARCRTTTSHKIVYLTSQS